MEATPDVCWKHPEYVIGTCRPCQRNVDLYLDNWALGRMTEDRVIFDMDGWRENDGLRDLLIRERQRLAAPRGGGHRSHEDAARRLPRLAA